MIILDVGAGAGNFTASALEKWPECEVICYEASQRGISALRNRFTSESRVTIVHAAVVPAGTEGPVKLYCGNDFRDSSLTQSEHTLDTYELTKVFVVTALPPHDVLHIETNGGEAALYAEAPEARRE